MDIIYQEELFSNIKEEVIPLLHEHWKELANHKEERPLDVDFDKYIKLNELGIIRILTARNEGKIIGYCSFMIANNLHYKTWKYALCDVYYLDPSYRKTGVSFELFKEIEMWLKNLDVKSMTVQDKVNHSHEKFFKSLGFDIVEQVYEKVL